MGASIDRLVVATLTRNKRSVADWFFIGDSIHFRGPHGDIGDWLTSDDRLFHAVRDYLRRIGAPVYQSSAEAIIFRPAGWEE
jgi:hypothetical protein